MDTTAPCNNCNNNTVHEILQVDEQRSHDPEDNSIWHEVRHEMLKCKGCKTVCLRTIEVESEDVVDNVDDAATTVYNPPRRQRIWPQWGFDLIFQSLISSDPEKRKFIETLHDLLQETHNALANKNPRLAAMGARAILDHVMSDKLGDHGGFAEKLDNFSPDYVSYQQQKIIERVLNVGHAATHRAYKPKIEDLHLILNIVESVLQQIYIYPTSIETIDTDIPDRPRNKRQTHGK